MRPSNLLHKGLAKLFRELLFGVGFGAAFAVKRELTGRKHVLLPINLKDKTVR